MELSQLHWPEKYNVCVSGEKVKQNDKKQRTRRQADGVSASQARKTTVSDVEMEVAPGEFSSSSSVTAGGSCLAAAQTSHQSGG